MTLPTELFLTPSLDTALTESLFQPDRLIDENAVNILDVRYDLAADDEEAEDDADEDDEDEDDDEDDEDDVDDEDDEEEEDDDEPIDE